MKILVVSQYYWPESFRINDLCKALVERGHEVTVYTGFPNYPSGVFFAGYSFFGPYIQNHEGVRIFRAPLFPRGGSSIKLAINYISFCLFSTLLAPLIIRGKYDRIFMYQVSPIFAALPAVFLKYLKNAPLILWIADLWPESLEATNVVKNKLILRVITKFVKFIYHASDKILITSPDFKTSIIELGVPDKKIKYWPQWAEKMPVSTEEYYDDRIPKDKFIVMFAGNIGTSQDFETIISAANLLKTDKKIHFIILGDGLRRKASEAAIAELGIQANFQFFGRMPIEAMPHYISKASAVLLSLTSSDLFGKTIPAKLQTYLSSGKPIISSANGVVSRIVDEWKSGLTCPASSPVKLAEAIKRMSQLTTGELSQMGLNAIECYESEFEREKLISILEVELNSFNTGKELTTSN